MTIPKELYTARTLYTLGGGSFAIVAASGVSGYVFGFNPRWLGLGCAFLIAFAGLAFLPEDSNRRSRWSFPLLVVAFFNGLLIYSQAVGINTLNQAAPPLQVKSAALVPVLDPVPWWPPAEQRRAARQMVDALAEIVAIPPRAGTQSLNPEYLACRGRLGTQALFECLLKRNELQGPTKELVGAALELDRSYSGSGRGSKW